MPTRFTTHPADEIIADARITQGASVLQISVVRSGIVDEVICIPLPRADETVVRMIVQGINNAELARPSARIPEAAE